MQISSNSSQDYKYIIATSKSSNQALTQAGIGRPIKVASDGDGGGHNGERNPTRCLTPTTKTPYLIPTMKTRCLIPTTKTPYLIPTMKTRCLMKKKRNTHGHGYDGVGDCVDVEEGEDASSGHGG